MKHIGLFEGIGGFSLAAHWMGWETIAWCEWNPFCQTVLKYHFPKAQGHGDIRTTDFTIYRGHGDIVTGGFPCQPYSVAGKQLGTEDERHLWPEMLRAVREIQPPFVVAENVSGLVNWNGGLVFNQVQADLEAEGYEVTPFLLPAAGVNAPHKRERVWFIAYSDSSRRQQVCGYETCNRGETPEQSKYRNYGSNGATPDTNSNGHEQRGFGENRSAQAESQREGYQREWLRGEFGRTGEQKVIANPNECRLERSKIKTQRQYATHGNAWDFFPTQSPLCSRNDGLSSRLAGITFSKHRNESLKAYGNAVIPQIVYEIFKAIEATST